MKFRLLCSVLVLLFLCCSLWCVQAEEDDTLYLPLGDGTEVFCAEDDLGTFFVRPVSGGFRVVAFRKVRRTVRRRLRRNRRKARRFARRGNEERAAEFEVLVATAQQLQDQIQQCRSETLPGLGADPGNGGDDPGDGDSGGGGGDTGGGGTLEGACAIAGGTSSFTRIINGEECAQGNSPVVMLTIDGTGLCSGTVIHPRAVLTAAHCFLDQSNNFDPGLSIQVRTGNGSMSAQSYSVHPLYTGFEPGIGIVADYDVAMVITASTIPTRVSGYVQASDITTGERTVIAGFGLDERGSSGVLRAGFMDVSGTEGDRSIQAIYDGTDSDTCNGDSGGPIFVLRSGEWIVAGTTSFGTNAQCAPLDEAHFAHLANSSVQSYIASELP